MKIIPNVGTKSMVAAGNRGSIGIHGWQGARIEPAWLSIAAERKVVGCLGLEPEARSRILVDDNAASEASVVPTVFVTYQLIVYAQYAISCMAASAATHA